MTSNSFIHICELTPAWQILFEQFGVSYKVVNWNNFEFKDCSCLIVNTKLFNQPLQKAHNYLLCGGYVLDTVNCFGIKSTLKYVTSKIQTEQLFGNFEQLNKFDYFSFVKFFKEGELFFNDIISINKYPNSPETASKLASQHINKNYGYIFSVGFNIEKIFSSTKGKRKFFISNNKVLPDEIVSKKSKGLFRRLILHILLEIHNRQNLKLQHLSHFPLNKPIFCFRVDTDFSDAKNILLLKKLCQKYLIKVTWFVHSHSEDEVSIFKNFSGDEIGVHTSSHKTPTNISEVKADINSVLGILKKNQIETHGYAAPFGAWNYAVYKAIHEFQFAYSSEFSLDYDNLPFCFKEQLQIPIHPICIGSFKRAKASDEDIFLYFQNVIQEKFYLNEPIILYHHPLDGRLNVLEKIFEYVNQLGLNKITMLDYAIWWKERNKILSKYISFNNFVDMPKDVILCDFKSSINDNQLNPSDKNKGLQMLKKLSKSKWRILRNSVEDWISKLRI